MDWLRGNSLLFLFFFFLKKETSEKNPVLDCYLDRRWQREATRVPLSPKAQIVKVSGQLPRSIKDIPETAAIGFASWAWRDNDQGNACLIDVGVASIRLSEVEQGLKSGKGTFSKEIPLIMHTVDNYEKGAIRVTFHEDHFQLNTRIESRISARVDNQVQRDMMEYVKENMNMEMALTETIEGASRMRVPYYMGEAGMQGGKPLPAIAYVMAETPRIDTSFWVNAHETVMRREGAKWDSLTTTGKARMTVLTVAYMIQYLDYVSDKVDHARKHVNVGRKLGYINDSEDPVMIAMEDHIHTDRVVEPSSQEACENFGDELTSGSGDCEDGGGGIAQLANGLKFHDFPPKPEFDKYREMQTLIRQYVPCLSLDVVNGAQVNQIASVGAHMNDNFIPVDMFLQDMEKTKAGKERARELRAFLKEEPMKGLLFLVGEGTGMYEPQGYKNPLEPIMGYVYSCPSLVAAKKKIEREQGVAGGFFKVSENMFTDFFYNLGDLAPLECLYCTRQSNGQLTRGASYEDMMNNRDQVAFLPKPPPSKQVMEHISERVLLRVPPRPLAVTDKGQWETKNPHLDTIVEAVKKFDRPMGSPAIKVPVYVRPHQLSAQLAKEIIRDFRKRERIWKVDYVLERITDDMYGYEMNVYVN